MCALAADRVTLASTPPLADLSVATVSPAPKLRKQDLGHAGDGVEIEEKPGCVAPGVVATQLRSLLETRADSGVAKSARDCECDGHETGGVGGGELLRCICTAVALERCVARRS